MILINESATNVRLLPRAIVIELLNILQHNARPIRPAKSSNLEAQFELCTILRSLDVIFEYMIRSQKLHET
jgi:hypothetical protein